MPSYSVLTNINQYGLWTNLSASGQIHTGEGELQGVIINSHSSGTLKIWDSLTASGTVMFNTMTFSAVATTGERFIPFFGARFLKGAYATIGGTADLTFIWN